jgi:predicted transcriptional regulator
MKVAVSIPDDLFDEADRLAEAMGTSRSGLYAIALSDFVRGRNLDEVTAALNSVVAAIGPQDHSFLSTAAKRVFDNTDW